MVPLVNSSHMPYHPHDEKTLGLFVEGSVLRAAFVIGEKKGPAIGKLFEIISSETESSESVKPLYTEKNLDPEEKELKQYTDTYLTVSGLSGSEVLVRRLKLKLTREKDIEETFAFQAEPQLPFPLEQAVLDKQIIEQQDGSTQLTFLAAKKDYIIKHLAYWQEKGIDPEVVSCEPVALTAFANQYFDPFSTQYIVHIGRSSILCVLLKEGKLLSSHVIQKGWESLYRALVLDRSLEPPSPEELFGVDFEHLSPENSPKLFEAEEDLFKAIHWNFLAQCKETKIKETPQLACVGEGANLTHLSSALAKALDIPLSEMRLTDGSISIPQANIYALPIGLALTAQPSYKSPINFRRQELSYATPWKRFQQPLYIYAALCLGLAFALYLFGLSYYQYKEDGLKQRYLTLLSLVQKPYDDFEKAYEAKFSPGRETLIPIQNLTAGNLNSRLDFLEKEIRSMPDTFPLLPNTPRVSDVLAWLSTHPSLVCSESNKENGECPTFNIDMFNYTMVKRPELNKKSEKYQVKVELEFSTSSPRIAREFHDALIAPNDFVDPKGEIKWNATKGKYRTSFYLKDKTTYPSPLKEL